MSSEANKHILVPKHSKLSDKEKEAVLDSYKITFKELPKILPTDQAVIKLNAKPGDVIKIERASRTAGHTIYYRAVAEE
ncbi:DNA-directed RNA polymerase subunit H [Candidatus Woesearchaeota archaeon]|nr:DNA-directed RNA polymerase subunit H [Candidatus Woesearchaeota archaeon]